MSGNGPIPRIRTPSGKQAGRQCLPHWLREGADRLLRVEYAIGMGQAELAADPGEDIPPEVQSMVATADDTVRQRARHWLLGNALAPHAKWRLPTEADMARAEAEAEAEPVTVADLERQLRELADAGDRSAIVTLLAALDPARYGPPGRMTTAAADSVDGVDFTPIIK